MRILNAHEMNSVSGAKVFIFKTHEGTDVVMTHYHDQYDLKFGDGCPGCGTASLVTLYGNGNYDWQPMSHYIFWTAPNPNDPSVSVKHIDNAVVFSIR